MWLKQCRKPAIWEWFIPLFMVMTGGLIIIVAMSFLPPMTGNGKHITYKNGDDWGMDGIVLPTLYFA